MKTNLKDFYEGYWQHRQKVGKIHTKKGYYVPERLKVAVSMISQKNKILNILDVGCGEGALGMLLREKFNSIYSLGCDISESSVELARPFYNKVFQINIDTENLKDKVNGIKFDYIVCVEVLEHLMYPEMVLEKCKEWISPDGFFIVSFPNIAWWKYRKKFLMGYFPEESRLYHHAEHLHDFTMHSFTELLNRVNLKIIKVDGEFIPPKWMKKNIPQSILKTIMYKYPNVFGYQVMIKAKKA
jgi:2-polyprenyl-3-methyl-5-hydroxy-6-metoxy-1,4-benzoquinol methylase